MCISQCLIKHLVLICQNHYITKAYVNKIEVSQFELDLV